MRPELYEELYTQEATHGWHVGKCRRVLGLIHRFGSSQRQRCLDVGCGTGGFLNRLSDEGFAVGMDHQAQALQFCRARGNKRLVCSDLSRTPWPFKDAAFDVVTGLDVVEHVEDDAALVAEIHRVLKPGGIVVVNVPAFQWLWSYWDEWNGHKRRYTRFQLDQLMQKCGFVPKWSSYSDWLTLLAIAPLRWFKQRRVKKGLKVGSDNAPLPGWANFLLLQYEQFETFVSRWIRLPWGTSVTWVGVK